MVQDTRLSSCPKYQIRSVNVKYGRNYMPDKWCVSEFCFNEEVRKAMRLPSKFHIRDSTIREGDEQPGCYMSPDDKLKVAEKVYEIGIKEIDVGFVGAVDEHYRTAQLIKKQIPQLETSAIIKTWVPTWKDELNRAIDAGVDRVEPWNHPIINHASDEQVAELGHTREELIPRIVEVIQCAKGQGVKVSYMQCDAMRSSWDFLESILSAVERAGIDRLSVAEDGYASPPAVRFLMDKLTELLRVPILWHSHNDFGLSVANVLAAVERGAQAADLIINGMGDKAGITSLEEVVVSLECMYGVNTGVKLEKLYGLSKFVEELTGIRCQPHKAIVGENAFLHESELHAYCIITGIWEAMEGFRAELVGNKRRVVFGDTTLHGEAARARLRVLGLEYTDEDVKKILDEIRKVLPKKHTISLEEFDQIAKKVVA